MRKTVQVDVPKEVVEESSGHITVITSPTDPQNARQFEEWFGASAFPNDVWMLVNAETGEVEEEHHANI